jgi:hypothetical protein
MIFVCFFPIFNLIINYSLPRKGQRKGASGWSGVSLTFRNVSEIEVTPKSKNENEGARREENEQEREGARAALPGRR